MHPVTMSRTWRQLKQNFEQAQTKNSQLTNEVQELVTERDSALSDIEDLRDGMQVRKRTNEKLLT